MRGRFTWLAVFVCAFWSLAAFALQGDPLLTRYGAREIPVAPGHMSVVSDDAGTIYVGNVEGVLHFAGGKWELFELPGKSTARSLHRAWDGRIYLGGYDLFGVLDTQPDGSLRFEDLRSKFALGGDAANVAEVWGILETSHGLFFRADRALFFLGRDGKTRQWPLGADVRLFFNVGDVLYARVHGVGLARFDDGRLLPVPGADAFSQRPLLLMASRDGHLLLASNDGFYRSDAYGIAKLPSDADAAFATNEPYSSQTLVDGSLVFGSYDGVLMRFSDELALLDRVKLGAHTLSAFGTDREGGLWVATEVDLVRLKLPSPWTVYSGDQGLVGSLNDSVWYDDTLWVATSVEVLRAERRDDGQMRFVPQHWTTLEAYDLEATEAGLLLAEREGVQVLDRGATQPRRLSEGGSTYQVEQSGHNPERAWVLGDREVLWLGLEAGRWQLIDRWPLQGMSVNAMYETAVGELWLGDLRGTAERWRFDAEDGSKLERRVFGPADGLVPDPDRGTTLLRLDNMLYAVSGDRVFSLDGERFVAGDLGAFRDVERPMELSAVNTPLGSYAWTSRQLWHRPIPESTWQQLHLDARAATGFRQADVHADGKLRVLSWEGLLQFDPKIKAAPEVVHRVLVRRATVRTSDGIHSRLPLASNIEIDLPSQSLIEVELALDAIQPGGSIRTRLDGVSDVWSDWVPADAAGVSVPNPGPGSYILHAEGQSADGASILPLAYTFTIRSKWWQTTTAEASFALLLLSGLFVMVSVGFRMRARRLIRANRELMREVAKRTSELERTNEELEASNLELKNSRDAVVQSGRRADLIFRALNDAMTGIVLDEHYRIEARLGSGGFGTVYSATQLHLSSRVAIKVFKPVPGHDARRSMDRFRAEGVSAFRVNHPNAVRVLDFAVSMDAVAYLVMEYLDGITLESAQTSRRIFTPDEAAFVIRPICEALAHAHEVGVIHRDVKPSNILICHEDDGTIIKLIDFGIAKVLDGATPQELRNLTATGLVMGTPNYMAPERLAGKPYGNSSDVYSVGVIAYELLSGSRPFADAGEDYVPWAMQRLRQEPLDLAKRVVGLPPAVAELVMAMVATAPSRRPSASDAAEKLVTWGQKSFDWDASRDLSAAPATLAVQSGPTQVIQAGEE